MNGSTPSKGLLGRAINARMPDPGYGQRVDGTRKGSGYLGALPASDGRVATELSIGVNIGGQETEIPAIVPTLTQEELNHLLNGGKVTEAIVQKAVDHAMQRMSRGLSAFSQGGYDR